jgi:hypothetical protein
MRRTDHHRYELMIANFLAFEEFCAVAHLRNKVRMDWGYESGDAVIMEANRHIINVFTSGKAYTDQVVRDFDLLAVKAHSPIRQDR